MLSATYYTEPIYQEIQMMNATIMDKPVLHCPRERQHHRELTKFHE